MIPYRPEPFTNFNEPSHTEALRQAIRAAEAELGKDIPLVLNGKRKFTDRKTISINPSAKDEVIGYVSAADVSLADKAVHIAHKAFKSWSSVSPSERARFLFKAAALMRRRKHEFSALLMLEAGKSAVEADADTAEAIDFMEYYGRQMITLSERGKETLIRLPGEDNQLDYIPLGVGVIIPPWNFPLAIMAGMTTASIVAGNTVVLKPASAAPVIAYRFVQLLEEAGLPAGVVNYVPGAGGEIGDFLVRHKLTRFIAFTGSRDVGVRIYELASQVGEGQIWLKRVIAEMGGKDSIIVDKDADLELAAKDIVQSAFGYSGQKCSACSRAIVHQDVYDDVLSRAAQMTRDIKVGDVRDFSLYTGPVIDENAYRKILRYIDIGKQEGIVVTGGKELDGKGYFIQPTIIADVHPKATIMQEEIFGPVLAFTKARDFNEALRIANNTEYGLTGALYSNNREHIERARSGFHVGNLYINRKCTGAIVGVHPFGGFNMSGTDSKAGGPDYLLQFTQPKLTSELY
jgi:1-pyrroline-5-carboxylate dehydrogenase